MSKFLDALANWINESNENKTQLETGLGIILYGVSSITSAIATKRFIEESNKIENPTAKQKVLLAAKCYAIPTITYAAGTYCFVDVNNTHKKTIAGYAAGYAALSASTSAYKGKVRELVGEEKERELQKEAIMEAKSFKPAPANIENRINDSDLQLFYEPYTNQLLYSTIDKVKLASVQLSNQIIQYGWANMNTFCTLLGGKCTTSGNLHGWDDRDPKIELYFDTELIDDKPVIVIGYRTEPLPINELR